MAAGFIIVILATATVLIAVALSQDRPRWWTVVDAADPGVVSTAEAVENGIASALTQVRASGPGPGGTAAEARPWSVFITTEQANAWLNVRLKRWLTDQSEQGSIDFNWPSELREVQVSFSPGLISIGARVMRPGASASAEARPQVLAATLRPALAADGSLWFTAEQVQVGRLPLPASWIIGRARRSAGSRAGDGRGEPAAELAQQPQAQRLLGALTGEGPVSQRPTIKLADGRRVRLVALEPGEGRLVVRCVTEQRGR